jgi:flagellar basal body rod protein FlgG
VLNTSAHNIANTNTPGFTRQVTATSSRPEGGVSSTTQSTDTPGTSLETDVVTQLQAKNSFLANLAVFKTQDKMAGTLLSLSA